MKTFKMPIAIERKINEVNDLLPIVKDLDETPVTYGGGTFPSYVDIQAINVKGKFVTIVGGNSPYSMIKGKERFNANKVSMFGDENCRKDLEDNLNIIIRTYRKALKNN